jgi:hypothetical protein
MVMSSGLPVATSLPSPPSPRSMVHFAALKATRLCFITATALMVLLIPLSSVSQTRGPPQRPECDEAAVIKGDTPVIPPGATDIEAPIDVNEDRGPLATLYPGLDTTTDAFYPLPCPPSIGGELPPGVNDQPTAEQVEAEKYLNEFETKVVPKIVGSIQQNMFGMGLPLLSDFVAGPCSIDKIPIKECYSPQFLISGQPFEGRDIIYVHGFSTEHLEKWLANDASAHKLWPQDDSEFLNPTGYFRGYARAYWKDHIRENLFDPVSPSSAIAGYQWTSADPAPIYKPKANRYLLIAWSSNQTIEYAQHAMLAQIRLAMMDGTNVVTPPTYPTHHVRPFCANGCIIISHSTGGLIVSTAMTLAKWGLFGPGAVKIPNHIRAHVAFNGAISGSRLATVAMSLGVLAAQPSASASQVLCPIEDLLFNTSGTCSLDTGFVVHTILRDLVPLVSQQVWGFAVASSPVPTLTVAGGHPRGNYAVGVTKFLLPGFDDGVVS